ncbi:hypothetical protein J2S14_003443 [Lederbergia wuyishanensis]|uniref:Uncharacterized protein n=1 Tax=Lederbergia wuyishanensis TaxID=1347903 RepID=A0ABU0D876_9BACI|nr:hypothetical protein [Lederbergia wuyishanensis]
MKLLYFTSFFSLQFMWYNNLENDAMCIMHHIELIQNVVYILC